MTRRTTSTRPSARRRRRPATPRTTSRSSSWTTAAATAPGAWPPPAPPTTTTSASSLHAENRGYGAALRTGIAAARCDWILLTDADLQFDLGELREFVAPAADLDLLVGYRLARMDPLPRRLNAYAWNRLVDRVFHLDIRDVDCAFKLIRRDLAQRLHLTADGAMISTELVARAALAGARMSEFGVHHRPRLAGRQSGADPAVVVSAFRELRRIRAELDATPVPPRGPAHTEPPQTAAA